MMNSLRGVLLRRAVVLTLLAFLTFSAAIISLCSFLPTMPQPTTGGAAPPPPQALRQSANPGTLLSEDEVREALSLTMQDAELRNILASANWSLAEAGAWYVDGEKVGATLLIRINEPVWASGTFRDVGGKVYKASLWLGSLHILVNLREGRVAAASPGMARAPADPPVASEEVEKARRVALAWVHGSKAAYLNAIFYTGEFQSGLAVFRVERVDGENLVAVNLATMTVEERYTG